MHTCMTYIFGLERILARFIRFFFSIFFFWFQMHGLAFLLLLLLFFPLDVILG